MLSDDSLVVCGDLHRHRLQSLKSIANKLAVSNLRTVVLDGSGKLPFPDDAFDAALVDAPCSGLGTLARHPEIKWRLEEPELGRLSALQTQLIQNAATTLKPGGILTYSVCSTEPEEGEDVISRFRSMHSEFRDVTRERLVEMNIDPQPLLTSDFGARTFTHRHGSESFFFCVLWKRR
jgi:16S rRNA (cytosine967-C5)-methyltransferase